MLCLNCNLADASPLYNGRCEDCWVDCGPGRPLMSSRVEKPAIRPTRTRGGHDGADKQPAVSGADR